VWVMDEFVRFCWWVCWTTLYRKHLSLSWRRYLLFLFFQSLFTYPHLPTHTLSLSEQTVSNTPKERKKSSLIRWMFWAEYSLIFCQRLDLDTSSQWLPYIWVGKLRSSHYHDWWWCWYKNCRMDSQSRA
jgi:hypothetical protein